MGDRTVTTEGLDEEEIPPTTSQRHIMRYIREDVVRLDIAVCRPDAYNIE